MPLTKDEALALLALADNRQRGGTRGKRGQKLDTNIRDYNTWFKLAHKLYDEATESFAQCDNPNCVDPRDDAKTRFVANINGVDMCRYCFLDGYMQLPTENQATLDAA